MLGDERGSFRGGFIIKVFGLLSAMLAFTVIFCIIVYSNMRLGLWFFTNPWILFVAAAVIIA